jgi:hypothetical protein
MMPEFFRYKHTQPDTILDPQLRNFDEALYNACVFFSNHWGAVTLRLWRRWQRLLPLLGVGYVPEKPEPPPCWIGEGTEWEEAHILVIEEEYDEARYE